MPHSVWHDPHSLIKVLLLPSKSRSLTLLLMLALVSALWFEALCFMVEKYRTARSKLDGFFSSDENEGSEVGRF